MIEISHVSKSYGSGSKAIRDLSLTIDDGEFVFITGRSGSGKSTLIKLLMKELDPTKGRIVVNDMDLGKMPRRYVPKYRRKLGVVFQDFRLLKDRTVFENVAFAQQVISVPSWKQFAVALSPNRAFRTVSESSTMYSICLRRLATPAGSW